MSRLEGIVDKGRSLARHAGGRTLGLIVGLNTISNFAGAVAWRLGQPRTWRRTVRAELVRQLYKAGLQNLRLIAFVALFLGLAIFVELVSYAGGFGQVGLARRLAVYVLVANAAPLLVAMIIIGRSGLTIMAELRSMRISGQVEMLEAQGFDTFVLLSVPRVAALAISVPLLTVALAVLTLAVGYGGTLLWGVAPLTPTDIVDELLSQITPRVYLSVVLETVLAGFFVGVTACLMGLRDLGRSERIARILPAGFVRCIIAVFVIHAIVGILT